MIYVIYDWLINVMCVLNSYDNNFNTITIQLFLDVFPT